MFNFKTLTFIMLVMVSTTSCNEKGGDKKVNKISAEKGLPKEKELLPYKKVYSQSAPADTTLPDGTFLVNLVNRDTLDETLYIKYGNKNFDSILKVEHGVYHSPCHDYEVCYATENTLGIIYQCMNSRSLTILPLNKRKTIIENLNPLFIDIKQGFTISLMEGDSNEENGDSLLVANLDFTKKQFIKINRLICADRIQCFDDVKIKGDRLYLTYTGAVPNADPRTVKQVDTIKLK